MINPKIISPTVSTLIKSEVNISYWNTLSEVETKIDHFSSLAGVSIGSSLVYILPLSVIDIS